MCEIVKKFLGDAYTKNPYINAYHVESNKTASTEVKKAAVQCVKQSLEKMNPQQTNILHSEYVAFVIKDQTERDIKQASLHARKRILKSRLTDIFGDREAQKMYKKLKIEQPSVFKIFLLTYGTMAFIYLVGKHLIKEVEYNFATLNGGVVEWDPYSEYRQLHQKLKVTTHPTYLEKIYYDAVYFNDNTNVNIKYKKISPEYVQVNIAAKLDHFLTTLNQTEAYDIRTRYTPLTEEFADRFRSKMTYQSLLTNILYCADAPVMFNIYRLYTNNDTTLQIEFRSLSDVDRFSSNINSVISTPVTLHVENKARENFASLRTAEPKLNMLCVREGYVIDEQYLDETSGSWYIHLAERKRPVSEIVYTSTKRLAIDFKKKLQSFYRNVTDKIDGMVNAIIGYIS